MINSAKQQDDRIVIVGAGPVGLSLALILARYSVPSLILESRGGPTPANESRAIVWMPKGLALLDWLGLTEEFKKRSVRRTAHEFWSIRERLFTLSFAEIDGPHQYSLQLPQHDTELLLEHAALRTGLVEIRRGHRVAEVGEHDGAAWVRVVSPSGSYTHESSWAVGCDGANSQVGKSLGIKQHWRDYGTDSAVADFEMECDLPLETSRIILDPARPYGFFYFAPGRWRFIYRINAGENRQQITSEAAASELLASKQPGVKINKFLWASAFRLGQGQSHTYRKGRWLLAGDAAHAMGPSAGAGMMVGMLGAWRLGWRLAMVATGRSTNASLLDEYVNEQRSGSESVQKANAQIFWNMAVTNPILAGMRAGALRFVSRVPSVARRIAAKEALMDQKIEIPDVLN
jgi:2-polyprenyl-6-methoxyphenol hydroxylase-like FAD-dependent oxidoreductase